MATALAPVESREVVRCDRCNLVQFTPNDLICRRCRRPLDDEPELAASARATVLPINGHCNGNGHLKNLAETVRSLRARNGLSQRELALRMAIPRTYISKIENRRVTPLMSSLERRRGSG